MLRILFLLLILIPGSCFASIAQLAIETKQATQLVNAADVETVGNAVIVTNDQSIELVPCVIVIAQTDAVSITFDCSDKERNRVEFEQLDSNRILIRSPGKVWVDVACIDFEKKIFGRTTVVVEVEEAVPPVPPDPPDPPSPPLPPDGPFDGIASRVAAFVSSMPSGDKTVIASILNGTADKMQRFEIRTFDQALDSIQTNWPSSQPAKDLLQFLSEDAEPRLLSWQQAQEYYREISKGVMQ
jgi:hypothetical protein